MTEMWAKPCVSIHRYFYRKSDDIDAEDKAVLVAALARLQGIESRLRVGIKDGVPYTVWTEIKAPESGR